jgi:hypothetical protein
MIFRIEASNFDVTDDAPHQPTDKVFSMKINNSATRFLHGQTVQVRTALEISKTLDPNGKCDGVPFMPEMVQYCGSRARVFRHANKTCVEGHGTRGMKDTVFLEDLRCDGSVHDGCQRNCLLFWKEAWLKPVEEKGQSAVLSVVSSALDWLPTRLGDRYYCQSTELYAATFHLSRWNVWQFLEEMRHGELSVSAFLKIVYRTVMHRLFKFKEVGSLVGTQKKGVRADLGLKRGDWVKVKETEDIRSTLDGSGRNFGLEFVPSMSEYIGGRYQVDFPIRKIILEQSGKMIRLSNTVALKGVNCQGLCVKNCPRSSSLYWREIWLQPASPSSVISIHPTGVSYSDSSASEGLSRGKRA